MNNNIAAATSQVALNRIAVNTLHLDILSHKVWLEQAYSFGDNVFMAALKAKIKKDTKKIAQYVVVQKAAKKHLAQMIANSRCSFYVEQKSLETILKSMRTALHDGVAVDIAENVRKYNDVRGMEAI